MRKSNIPKLGHGVEVRACYPITLAESRMIHDIDRILCRFYCGEHNFTHVTDTSVVSNNLVLEGVKMVIPGMKTINEECLCTHFCYKVACPKFGHPALSSERNNTFNRHLKPETISKLIVHSQFLQNL